MVCWCYPPISKYTFVPEVSTRESIQLTDYHDCIYNYTQVRCLHIDTTRPESRIIPKVRKRPPIVCCSYARVSIGSMTTKKYIRVVRSTGRGAIEFSVINLHEIGPVPDIDFLQASRRERPLQHMHIICLRPCPCHPLSPLVERKY